MGGVGVGVLGLGVGLVTRVSRGESPLGVGAAGRAVTHTVPGRLWQGLSRVLTDVRQWVCCLCWGWETKTCSEILYFRSSLEARDGAVLFWCAMLQGYWLVPCR
jgi:hypothetical protein